MSSKLAFPHQPQTKGNQTAKPSDQYFVLRKDLKDCLRHRLINIHGRVNKNQKNYSSRDRLCEGSLCCKDITHTLLDMHNNNTL